MAIFNSYVSLPEGNMKDVMQPYTSQTSRQIQFFLGHLVLSHVTCHGSGSMFESRHGVFSRPLRRKLSRIHSMPWDAFGAATFELPTGSTGDVLSTFTNPFLDMFTIFTAHLLDQKTQKTWKGTRHGCSWWEKWDAVHFQIRS